MNQAISESIQQAITPGICADLYYAGETNTKKSCYSSYVENRYQLDLPSLAFGSSSTLLFNPDSGLSHVILRFVLPAAGAQGTSGNVTYQRLGLASGWGYNLIESVGLRIGSSSYYTFTGDQLFAACMMDAEDSMKRNKLVELGGQALQSVDDFVPESKRTALVYLKCPWNSVSAQELPLPLPTDLITQPVQWSIKLRPAREVFYQLTPPQGQTNSLPVQLAEASANFKQVHMNDQGNLLARRENMNERALALPLSYFQNTTFRQVYDVTAGSEVQLNLTGFRSGSLKDMTMWVIKESDFNEGNPWKWVPVKQCVIKVNGLVYYDSRNYSNQLLSLIETKTGAYMDAPIIAADGQGGLDAQAYVSQFTIIPFAQHVEKLANGEDENVIALGLNVQNSVVNASIMLGEDAAGQALTGRYLFNFSYNYISTLMFSRGGCEYIF